MSKIYKKPPHCKTIDGHQKYLSRITKTLYYGKLPKHDVLSLPATELAVEFFSEAQRGRTLERLHFDTAADISRNACVSPCSLVLAMLYFERLKICNSDYLERTVPSELFLVSLMVSSKFLFDDGETDQVFMDEWAESAGITCKDLAKLERDFLQAINWEIFANEFTFWKKLHDIEKQLAMKQGNGRGYFTYTELDSLGDTIDLHNVVQSLVAISLILTATYTAVLLSLIGSVAVASIIPGTSLYRPSIISNEAQVEVPLETNDTEMYHEEVIHLQKPSQPFNLNALQYFKASLLLTSIKAENAFNDTFDSPQANCQEVSWDWWNVPVMDWLSRTSSYIESFEPPQIKNFVYFWDNLVINEKLVYLEDHIQKATETRMQDQLERTWHMEWIDTIKWHLSNYNILTYLQTIKP